MKYFYILTLAWRQAAGVGGGGCDNELTRTGLYTPEPGDTFGSAFTRIYDGTAALLRLDGTEPAGGGFNVAYFDLRPDLPLEAGP